MRDILDAAAAENYHWRERIWTPIQTLWAFLVQVLEPDCSCREAVAHILAEQAVCGQQVTASPDPSAYCQGRQRLPLSLFKSALRQVGQRLQAKVGSAYSWCGRRVWIVDGSTCSMPDTPSLQQSFGQPGGQKPGCGFPRCSDSGHVLLGDWGCYRCGDWCLSQFGTQPVASTVGAITRWRRCAGRPFFLVTKLFHPDIPFRVVNSRE